ncbi:MAG: hypothetical protein AAFQ98_15735 [Bacteroidota bacterium]
MKPLFVLLTATLLALIVLKILKGDFQFALAARIGMSTMLMFTALGHFLFPEGMALMIPSFIPYRLELVYITGVLEILGAIGLHVTQFSVLAAWCLIVFFLSIVPVNIKASMDHLNYQTATYDGPGLAYLWFRIPLQVLFIAWVYFSTIRKF